MAFAGVLCVDNDEALLVHFFSLRRLTAAWLEVMMAWLSFGGAHEGDVILSLDGGPRGASQEGHEVVNLGALSSLLPGEPLTDAEDNGGYSCSLVRLGDLLAGVESCGGKATLGGQVCCRIVRREHVGVEKGAASIRSLYLRWTRGQIHDWVLVLVRWV